MDGILQCFVEKWKYPSNNYVVYITMESFWQTSSFPLYEHIDNAGIMTERTTFLNHINLQFRFRF